MKGWEQGWVIHPSPPAAPPQHMDVAGGDSRGPGAQAAGGKAGTVPLCIPTEPAGLGVTCPFPVSLCSGKDRGEPQVLCCGRGPAQAGKAEGVSGTRSSSALLFHPGGSRAPCSSHTAFRELLALA